MRCEQARQLFDAYLDGELPPALVAELGAHRVQCAECRRTFALLEVSGHIIASDRDPVGLREDFAERLLGCLEMQKARWPYRVRRLLYFAGPLAAAAVIALAFVGVFDRAHDTKVAGDRSAIEVPTPLRSADSILVPELADEGVPTANDDADRALQEWVDRTQENLSAKLESGEKLRESFDLTILQWLDIFNSPESTSDGEGHFPGADIQLEPEPDETVPTADPMDQVEDL